MKFRLVAVLYASTLLAASMMAFGPIGGLLAGAATMIVHGRLPRKHALPMLVYGGLLAGLLFSLVTPAIEAARDSARLGTSHSQMQLIQLNLLSYQNAFGRLPPPATTDRQGRLLHSWRIEMLPMQYLRALHQQIDKTIPWDDPANLALVEGVSLPDYHSPRAPKGSASPSATHFLGVVGEGAAWRSHAGATLAGPPPDETNPVLLIEAVGLDIPWYEPRDLSLEQAVDVLVGEFTSSQPRVRAGYFASCRWKGDGVWPRLVAFADGSRMAVKCFQDREAARRFLTHGCREGGVAWGEIAWRDSDELIAGYIIHWGRIGGVAFFITVAAAPFFRQSLLFLEADKPLTVES